MMNVESNVIGIDLGGTKIAGCVLNSSIFDEPMSNIKRARVPTPKTYKKTVEDVCFLVAELERMSGVQAAAVGIGIPGFGPFTDPDHRIVSPNLPWLKQGPFVADIAKKLGRPVVSANDADCFALSEAMDGAAKGSDKVFGLTLGTGVGGGFVFNGKINGNGTGIGCEIGHVPLPWREKDDGAPRKCGCGRMGCIETVLNGPAWNSAQSPETYFKALAKACAMVTLMLDPEVIVIGGGLYRLPGLYETVPDLINKYTQGYVPKLVPAQHSDASGMRGAAWLALQSLSEKDVQLKA